MIVLVLVILPLAVHGTEVSEEDTKILLEVPASEILAKIQDGEPVEYDHVIIKGDLDLSQLSLQTNITSPIRINESKFNGFVTFNDAIFDLPIDLSGSYFTQHVCIRNATFRGDVDFGEVTFSEYADFSYDWHASYPVDSLLSAITYWRGRGATFSGSANFEGANFSGMADFRGANFSGSAYFDEAKFGKYADFRVAEFSGGAYFSWTSFSSSANFGGAIFGDDARFDGSTFNRDAKFSYVTFDRNADFGEATFSDYVDFGKAMFGEGANFERATFSGRADFSEVMFNEIAAFNETSFKGYVIGWTYIKTSKFDEAAYLALVKNFKDHGQFDEADDCHFTYRFHNMKKPSDYLAWATCGFGVKWLQTIYFGISLIIIFGLVYFLTIVRNDPKEIIATQLFDSLWFSAMVLLSIPSELYPKKIDVYREYTKHMKYHLPILERLMGWGILILFINTLSRSMLHL